MKYFVLFMGPLLLSVACHRKASSAKTPMVSPGSIELIDSAATPVESYAAGTPGCIQKIIDSIRQKPVWNPPAEIYLYSYQDKNVYLISANCCDQFTTLVDEDCHRVCAPSGGFTGKGDRKCPDFDEQAKKIRLVWKDDRKKK